MPPLLFRTIYHRSAEDYDLVRVAALPDGGDRGDDDSAHRASQLLARSAAELLHEQWPRGGPISQYQEKVVDSSSCGLTASSLLALPCSFLLVRSTKSGDCGGGEDATYTECVG